MSKSRKLTAHVFYRDGRATFSVSPRLRLLLRGRVTWAATGTFVVYQKDAPAFLDSFRTAGVKITEAYA